MQLPENSPFSVEQKQQLSALLPSLSQQQIYWLSGYLAGVEGGLSSVSKSPAPPAKKLPVTVLYGTESGNAEKLGADAQKALSKLGFKAKLVSMADVKAKDLAVVENLLVVTSTWGDGDPPENAEDLHAEIMGKGAPKMDKVSFSVCALGDTGYEKFCQTGKDFDARLEALGGKRLSPRQDCDVDFDVPFQKWLDAVTEELKKKGVASQGVGITIPRSSEKAITYDRKNPFPATLTERVLLNGRGSSKETYHLEFSLEGSGLSYDAGDALALKPQNDPKMVEDILKVSGLSADESVVLPDRTKGSLREALLSHYDITGLSRSILSKYNELAQSKNLEEFLDKKNSDKLKDYLWGRQIIDLLEEYPIQSLGSEAFLKLLRKLPIRLYSIASSILAHPDEVHLTIGAVRYHSHGRDRKGVASTYVADDLEVGGNVPVYLHHNKNFKLPKDGSVPVIMVGPGTGIAPFRSFIEERGAKGDAGKNWLLFGDQHYTTDFLYQLEWQDYLKSGLLNRLDVAFSRDQKEKVYVQHRMLENQKEIYEWLQGGGHFYVCGDASRMANDVHEALITIYTNQGGISREDAEAAVKQLQKDKRYQRDVY